MNLINRNPNRISVQVFILFYFIDKNRENLVTVDDGAMQMANRENDNITIAEAEAEPIENNIFNSIWKQMKCKHKMFCTLF